MLAFSSPLIPEVVPEVKQSESGEKRTKIDRNN